MTAFSVTIPFSMRVSPRTIGERPLEHRDLADDGHPGLDFLLRGQLQAAQQKGTLIRHGDGGANACALELRDLEERGQGPALHRDRPQAHVGHPG